MQSSTILYKCYVEIVEAVLVFLYSLLQIHILCWPAVIWEPARTGMAGELQLSDYSFTTVSAGCEGGLIGPDTSTCSQLAHFKCSTCHILCLYWAFSCLIEKVSKPCFNAKIKETTDTIKDRLFYIVGFT